MAVADKDLQGDGGKGITMKTPWNREEVLIMPRFDGTGPRGEGPMTGGGFGYCGPGGTGYGRPGRRFFGRGRGFSRGFGPGFGLGRGYGRGSGWGAFPPYGAGSYGPRDEVEMLKEEADALKNELDAINGRIEELESRAAESDS